MTTVTNMFRISEDITFAHGRIEGYKAVLRYLSAQLEQGMPMDLALLKLSAWLDQEAAHVWTQIEGWQAQLETPSEAQ